MKKAYILPLMQVSMPKMDNYMAGVNSIPEGEGGGPGIAEGKERQDDKVKDDSWGSLW